MYTTHSVISTIFCHLSSLLANTAWLCMSHHIRLHSTGLHTANRPDPTLTASNAVEIKREGTVVRIRDILINVAKALYPTSCAPLQYGLG